MASAQLAFQDARGGMNAFDPPHKIAINQVARMVNCQVMEGMPTTRMGCRTVPLESAGSEFISEAPFQGSIFYNPAKGQGGIAFSADNASLAIASGGRKFRVTFAGRKTRSVGSVSDITDGLFGNGQSHLAWMSQWEDMLVIADGEGKTFTYSPAEGSAFSHGYDLVNRLKSELPNSCTCLAYVHGRGTAVINSREILVGDGLFRTSLTTSENLRGFTEQTFLATGQRFVPPTSMGGIAALAVLPLKNTQHGHGSLLAHCQDGIFSVDLNQPPRSSWADKPLVKVVTTEAGAVGPYAVALVDGDQYYRTRKGVQTLRSAAATSGMEGSPEQTLSPEVDTWFAADYYRWLRFCSACSWSAARRVFFTVAPIVQGSYRWHRGIVVRNTDISPTSDSAPAIWEGLWTLHPEDAGVIQLVNGIFDGEERQFAWVRGNDGKNRLAEFSPTFREDILEDGTTHPIRCQVITRAIDAGEWWKERQFSLVRLYLANIAGRVDWGVWFRAEGAPAWKFLRSGYAEVKDLSDDPFDLVAPEERSAAIPLGKIPAECSEGSFKPGDKSRSLQFLVRWQGYCSLEGVKVEVGDEDISKTDLDNAKFGITFPKATTADYEDFEYSLTNRALWIETK